MEEQLIIFETAKLAKEKGFDEPTKFLYSQWSRLMPEQTNASRNSSPSIGDIYFNACTQSLLQKWLREVHKLDITVALVANGYGFYIHKDRNYTNDGDSYGVSGHTYEIALEEGLKQALKLINNDK